MHHAKLVKVFGKRAAAVMRDAMADAGADGGVTVPQVETIAAAAVAPVAEAVAGLRSTPRLDSLEAWRAAASGEVASLAARVRQLEESLPPGLAKLRSSLFVAPADVQRVRERMADPWPEWVDYVERVRCGV